jgi:hypothetical protein
MIRLLVILPLLVAFSQAQADTDGSYLDLFQGSAVEQRSFYASLYTAHYDPDPDHNNNQQMLGLEIELRGNRLWGFAMFDNSFGQESQYLYIGKKWRVFESDRWYFKLTSRAGSHPGPGLPPQEFFRRIRAARILRRHD